MSQLTRKFITNDAVDGTKIHLDNNQAIRARNAANSADINLLLLDASNIAQVAVPLTITGNISASNMSGSSSGTNTGDITLAAVGSSPNANAATLVGQALNLELFSSAQPGVVPASGGGTTNFLRADGTWAAAGGSGANQSLSNLTNPTAINQDLIFDKGAAALLKTKNDSIATQNLTVISGDSSASTSGHTTISTGATPGGGTSGHVAINTGNAGAGGFSGGIALQTGSGDFSGSVSLASGVSNAGPSGEIDISSGNPSIPDAGGSGSINLFSGNVTGADGSGEILLTTGTTATGPSGPILINSGSPSGAAASGVITINSGDSPAGTSGILTLKSGNSDGNSGAVNLKSGDASTNNSGALTIASGTANAVSGTVSISSGSTGTANSGNVNLVSGDATGGVSGDINILTGATDTNNSGQIFLATGQPSAANIQSGGVQISSGAATGTAASGAILVASGTVADGVSGTVTLQVGTVTGTGTRGKIQFLDGSEGTSGYVWTSTDISGHGTWMAAAGAATNNKELITLSGTNITNQYIDLAHVAKTNSIDFLVKGGGIMIEGASYDYSVSYTGGAGGNTRITFLNDLATGGASALIAGDVVVAKYQY